MARSIDAPVLIAGGGPVGLTLALDLGWRGIPSLLLEQRLEDAPANPRCNTTNARSMEHFRRLGCADAIRAAGLPPDHPTDVVYVTRFAGHELARLVLPASSVRRGARGVLDEGWPTPEPQHRISQVYLEPIIAAHARTFPGVELRSGWRVESLEPEDERVIVRATDLRSGRATRLAARWLVACDGGRSDVRRRLDIPFVGDDQVGARVKSVYLRSRDLAKHDRNGPAWMYWVINREQPATIVALDGRELWICHLAVPPGSDFEELDVTRGVHAAVGAPIEFEVLGIEPWTPRRLVAERYRDGRVFLAGDAAHIWLPLGGFGMNAGIGDATWLAWALAAVERGWGGGRLLDAYQTERRPIGELISNAAIGIRDRRGPSMQIPPEIEADTEQGASLRRLAGPRIAAADGPQFNSVGVQLGYYYADSPLLWPDGTPPPEFAIERYTPDARPGSRAPHLWLEDGRALYDALGRDFTLLRLGAERPPPDARALREAFARRRVPLAELDVPTPEARSLYGAPLALVRPDQHVAWRAAALPADPLALVDRVRGE